MVAPAQNLEVTCTRRDERIVKRGKELAKIRKPRRSSSKNDDRDLHAGRVLLIGQITVDGDEHIELCAGKLQKSAILDVLPSELLDGLDIVLTEVSKQSPVNTFIEQ